MSFHHCQRSQRVRFLVKNFAQIVDFSKNIESLRGKIEETREIVDLRIT